MDGPMTAPAPDTASASNLYDVDAVRADFPILSREIYGKPLVYLDNGASAQKPNAVIDGMAEMMRHEYANIHRGAHFLSQAATDRFEAVRETAARFLNAGRAEEIVFTRNATEAINLVAHSFLRPRLGQGDRIIVSHMEHHANIVPWQMLAGEKGATLDVVPISDEGVLDMDAYAAMLGPDVKLVAIAHASNVLGTINPAAEIVRLAHAQKIPVLLDGAQAAVHAPVDVRAIGADFYVVTGHKLYGPSGVGVLYGRYELLEEMPPYQGGGDMIETVSFTKGTTFKAPPYRFEAGTPAIVEVVGLGIALDYMAALGLERIAAHEAGLLEYAMERLSAIPGFRPVGTAPGKAAIISFNLAGIHPLDVATILDRQGVAVRVGQHCAEPLIERMGLEGAVRASFGLYNTRAEVDALVAGVEKAQSLFG